MNIHMKDHNQEKILKLLKERRIITSSELASFLSISWNTADKWLLELALDEKVERMKKSGVNLWMLR